MNNSWDGLTHEQLFAELINRLTQKKSERIYNVEKSYELASKLHSNQFRHSGEPYITHPLIVATILEKLDFDTDVISGGILHDTVEDCDYTIDQMKTDFNQEIAEIVDGVTAINKNDYMEEMDSIFDNSNFLKPSLENKTYQKLLKIGKKNRFAFFIKFADRLHNLKTIHVVPEYKQLEKVKETERWILPITKLLKTSFFYYQISNECFKIVNDKKLVPFTYEYEKLLTYMAPNAITLRESLFEQISNYLAKTKSKNVLYKVLVQPLLEQQVVEQISQKLQIKSLHNMKASHLASVPTHDITIVLKNEINPSQANDLLFQLLEDNKMNSLLKIIGFTQDKEFGQNYFLVRDQYRNQYRICLLSYASYVNFTNGSLEGTLADLIDEENENVIETEFIKVKTRSEEVIKIPAGSTVLDFAFKIHNEIGFSFKHALVNNSPNKFPQYTKLKDGDKVTIVCETESETKQVKYVAQIRWLAYVNTDYAKKALIRYFEHKMDNR